MLAQVKWPKAFSLLEITVALGLLAAICSSVLVVMNRCVSTTINHRTKMEAFELVRENLEKVLAADSVTLMSELGVSDKNPDIQWETVIETFSEPVTSRMWLQAVCSASYTDTSGEKQTVELTHWLTYLTKKDQKLIQEQKELERQYLEQLAPDMESYDEYDLQPDDSTGDKDSEILKKLLDESGISL
jgi:type II secretory pathway pseudopilin PulG